MENLTKRDAKKLAAFIKNHDFDTSDAIELHNNIRDGKDDFEVGNYRFIIESEINDIMQEELKSDLYLLGCFKDWFLADVLEIGIDVIQAIQNLEAYEAVGKIIISMGKLEELQEKYVRADGYGHHFNPYDSCEDMLNLIDTDDYYVFQVN